MKIYRSCKQAVADCIAQKTFTVSHQYSSEKTFDVHVHDCYEVYYSISGARQFLIDDRLYDVAASDLFFINQYESHCLTSIDDLTHERIVLSICPAFLRSLCTGDTDLDACFRERPQGHSHRRSLCAEDQRVFLSQIDALAAIDGYGADIRQRAAFASLMVFLCGCFQAGAGHDRSAAAFRSPQIEPILSYINQHLDEPLTLERLSARFYLSTSYLCRLFRASAGTTVSKYITAQRITRAKQLLQSGCIAAEAAALCGFHDYNNFYKAFKKATGISPGRYARRQQNGPT